MVSRNVSNDEYVAAYGAASDDRAALELHDAINTAWTQLNKRDPKFGERTREVLRWVLVECLRRRVRFPQQLTTPRAIAYRPNPEQQPDRWLVAKFGRYIRKHLQVTPQELSDPDLGRFIEAMYAPRELHGAKWQLHRGRDLIYVYEEGVGSGSCMTGEDAYKMKWLADNPAKVGVLTVESGNRTGRALLWLTDNSDIVVDRVYPAEMAPLFFQYARRRGWWIREEHGPTHCGFVFPKTGDHRTHFTVTLDDNEDNVWPYLDSFSWGVEDGDHITLHSDVPRDADYMLLHETDGTAGNRYFCEYCGDRMQDPVASFADEYYCSIDCLRAADRAICDSCGVVFAEDDGIVAEDGSTFCDPGCAETAGYASCHQCGCWYDEADMERTSDSHELMCDACADDAPRCEECCSLMEDEDSLDDGLCSACVEQKEEVNA